MMPKPSPEIATCALLDSTRRNFRTILKASALLLFTLIGALVSVAAHSQTVAFDQKQLDFNGNGSISSGTSLKFGPDGNLYVSQVNGVLKVFTIVRNETTTEYQVTDSETILAVQSIPNHNDDGSLAPGTTSRQVTGITVGGSAGNVEWYVTSSDSRIGGPSGDLNLDTNSGVITRLTRNGSGWDAVDIVRGLPRSEENHAPNGLEIVTISPDGEPPTRYLIVSIGGFTNAGSPSNNFAFITEYALSASVIAVNLDMLESMPILIDPVSGRSYIYDLPTLDDPTRDNVNGVVDPDDLDYNGIDIGDPWGGNDGLNMAMVVPGGPVQIFSPGYRNSYDLVVTESGAVYVTDNGANGGWGGFPENEASPSVNNNYREGEPGSNSGDAANSEPQVNNADHLNLVTTDIHNYVFGSVYGGHPTPLRANVNAGLYTVGTHTTDNSHFRTIPYDPNGAGEAADPGQALPANWPPVPASEIDVANADFRHPGLNNPDSADPAFAPFIDPLDDITVTTWPTNTNGIDEYTASNFGGQLQGALIAGQNNNSLHLVQLDENGHLASLQTNWVSGLGGNPLGITTQGDSDIFPGTIWVAPFNSNIVILEPNDFVICIGPLDPGYDPQADNDFDGFTNQDEEDNGTDPCSGASQPDDIDGDKISNLNDLDDDGDGINDEDDPFQLGTPKDLPQLNELFSDQLDSEGELFGFRGLGLTGLMNNGDPNPNWLAWIDRIDLGTGPNDILGGAIGAVTIQQTGGTAAGLANSQEKAFQYGVNVGTSSGPFVIESRMFGFNEQGQLYDFTVDAGDGPPSQGIFIGTGFQDNYIEFVLTQAGLTLREEVNDSTSEVFNATIDIPDRPQGSTAQVILFLIVDPTAGTVEGQYIIDADAPVSIGTISAEGAVLAAIQQIAVPLAVGLIGTSGAPETADPNDDKEFAANWDYLVTTGTAPYVSAALPDLERAVDDPPEMIDLDDYFDDDNGTANLIYSVEENTDPAITANIAGNILTLTYPGSSATSEITVRATDAGLFFVEQTFTVTVSEDPVPIIRINAGGGTVSASDGGPNWEANTTGGATTGPSYSVNTGNIATHNIPLGGRHASIPEYISDTEFTQLFADERWDPAEAPEMLWSIPVANGTYEVRLYMGNGFAGTSGSGQRVFGVNIEGGPQEITGLDLSSTYGHQVGAMESYTVVVSDGVLNIEFLHQTENPLINAIEVLAGPGVSVPITVSPIAPLFGFEGSSPTLAVEATGGDGALNYEATGLPPGLAINPVSGVISGSIQSGAAAGSPYNVTVTVDDSDAASDDAATEMFTWSVSQAPDPGDVLFRINAGGPLLADAAGNWSADQSVANAGGTAATGSPSPYLDLSGTSADTTFGAAFTGNNPTGAPNALFETERFSDVAGTVDNMQYDIPVPSGNYVVNLYFAEIWDGAQTPGVRVFSVQIEGQLVIDDLDQTASYGWNNAAVQSFAVTVNDDNLDIDFLQGVQNPSIKGIEVLQADMPANSDAAAVVAINPGTDIGASTFGGGLTIANNSANGLEIASVTFNLSTALFPNMVFDPVGTAGDATALCFDAVSGAAETGLITDGSGAGAGSCSAPFSNPRGNGGFDALTIDFNDFDPGEVFEFAVDIDPTSIEGDPGSGDAGSVSGLELAGTVVSVTFADGTTVLTGETYRVQPSSNGGSVNTLLPTPLPAAPGLSINPAVLAPASLPGAQNATVPSLSPTVQVSGPVGANVSLLVVQAERTVPVADLFEANSAVAVNEFDAVIGGSGTVNIPVTLSDSGETQLNYLAAVIVQPDGRTSNLSTVWRVNYDPQVAGAVLFRVNAGGDQLAAADASLPDWSADTDVAPSEYRLDNGGGANTFGAFDANTHPGPIIMTSPTLPPSAPAGIFEIERWDAAPASNPPQMEWEFPVAAGSEVTVRLFFAELFNGVTAPGQRVFDVAIEGVVPPAFNDIDQFAVAGAKGAFMLAATTTVSADGILDIDFVHDVIENPAIKGIEIIAGSAGTPMALIQVNPGEGLAASTFTAGSFVVENLGDVNIASVTFDTGTGFLPDIVFDPNGTAGDVAGLCLTPNDGAAETGFQAPTDLCNDPFGVPHNGTNGDDGFETLTVNFDDFDTGEVFTFSVDMDPTSIKNDITAGDAGAVSGFELIGSTVTVTFDDGRTLVSSLFDESSLGGSIAIVESGVPAAPALALQGFATPTAVPDANQTVVVSGAPGGNVWLLQVDARLYIDAGGGGYDIDPFEANDAMAKVLTNATIGAGGNVAIPVTLLSSETGDAGPDGGINHFIAVEDGSGVRSTTSNVLVVEFDPDVVAGGTLDGTMLLQGRTDYSGEVTVTLFDESGIQVGLPVVTTANSDGQFSVPGIAEGTYQVAVKHPKYLQKVALVAIAAGSNPVNFGQANAGDANNDNLVTLPDFSVLANTFNKSSADAGYDDRADFNGDGLVTLVDFSLLASNFNTQGDTVSP